MPVIKSKVRVIGDYIAIKLEDPECKTPGGIVIPDNAQDKSTTGVVAAVGGGIYQNGKLIEMSVQVGDRVVIDKYAGSKIDVGGEELTITSERDVLAILR